MPAGGFSVFKEHSIAVRGRAMEFETGYTLCMISPADSEFTASTDMSITMRLR